ncbi:hypothetical protein [Deminuibacter soli]|uniref:Outer membrane protein beta-barrel domain-containing protein n=1 Tax=Deminuibacter soli TaxID=2291815 RepID=A0A3E1NKH0_9BACT|nr:hypothetical protein [Deminuibacter soli]RFM28439.1 hypothetical protein DXN05_06415 [Deminuibacter soli]
MKQNTLVLVLVAMLLSLYGAAQNPSPKWSAGVSVNPGLATQLPFQTALGGDLFVQHRLNNHLAATVSAGYTHFFEKDHFNGYTQYSSPFNVVPVKAGLKYFEGDKFYIGLQAGAGFAFEQWKTSFVWSPAVGVMFDNGTDISLHYEDFTGSRVTKQIALNLAWAFGLHPKHNTVKTNTPKAAGLWKSCGWLIDAGINSGISLNPGTQFALGITAGVEKSITQQLSFTAHTGFTHVFASGEPYHIEIVDGHYFMRGDRRSDHNIIPVKAGLKFYPATNWFVAAEAGIGIDINGNSAATWSPSIGHTLSKSSEIAARYERFGDNIGGRDMVGIQFNYRLVKW